jgi:hypothetical protein
MPSHEVHHILTPSLQIREPTLSARLAANVEKHRPTRLVVRQVKEVSLLERIACMRYIAVGVREMINLRNLGHAQRPSAAGKIPADQWYKLRMLAQQQPPSSLAIATDLESL